MDSGIERDGNGEDIPGSAHHVVDDTIRNGERPGERGGSFR